MKRVNIFMGNYGCGKTELSINAALALRERGQSVLLADMDIVNPYFRSSEMTELLVSRGVEVIAPVAAHTQVDVPALPAELYRAFEPDGVSVIDCGGDPAGATALGAYADRVAALAGDCEAYFVVNARRPLMQTVNAAAEMLQIIEHVSGVRATGIVNNTNLSYETTADDLLYGYDVCAGLSQRCGLPLCYNSGAEDVIRSFDTRCPGHEGKSVVITPYMRPYWQEGTRTV